jgi:PAS domain S-box-containing protein
MTRHLDNLTLPPRLRLGKQRHSLRLILVACLVGLQLFAIAAVMVLTTVSTEQALQRQSRGLLEEAGNAVISQIKAFLSPVRQAATLSARLTTNGALEPTDLEALESHMFRLVQTAPQIFGMYYADPTGRFVFVTRDQVSGQFRTKIITDRQTPSGAKYIWRDSGYSIVRTEDDPIDEYDPRSRPWYQGVVESSRPVWTDPYIFYTSGKPGLTYATPIMDRGQLTGVFGVDIRIDAIAELLSGNWASRNGASIILTRNGDVIAHPAISYGGGTAFDDQLSLVRLSEVDDPVARQVFDDQLATVPDLIKGPQFDLLHQGNQEHVSMLMPFDDWDLPWLIAIHAPQENFIGELQADRTRLYWIAFMVAVLNIGLGVFMADRINKPVQQFAKLTRRVARGDEDPRMAISTPYRELEPTGETLVHEIRQRRRFETAYGRTFEMASRGMAQISPEGTRFLRVNDQLCTMLGHPISYFTERSVSEALGPLHGERLGAFRDAMQSDSEFSIEAPFPASDGRAVWLRMNAILVRDDAGEPDHVLAIFDDVSEAREALERAERFKRDMNHATRVNMMGEFASGLAHELNQPLSAIVHDVDTAKLSLIPAEGEKVSKAQLADRQEITHILNNIESQALRAGDIIRALRNLIRKDRGQLRRFDLVSLCEQTISLMEHDARDHGIDLRFEQSGPSEVLGNRTQIGQVIVNFLRNAIDALGTHGGTDRKIVLRVTGFSDRVDLEVEDNGPGVPTGMALFSKFETVKPAGIGLGLSICRSIAAANNGKISHRAMVPHGALFCLSLPRPTHTEEISA